MWKAGACGRHTFQSVPTIVQSQQQFQGLHIFASRGDRASVCLMVSHCRCGFNLCKYLPDIEHLFMCLSSVLKTPWWSICLNLLSHLLLNHLFSYWVLRTFSLVILFIFLFTNTIFQRAVLFLMEVQFVINCFFFSKLCPWCQMRNLCFTQHHRDFSAVFCLKSFIVLGSTIRPMIRFKLLRFLIWYEVRVQVKFLA